MLSFYKQTIFFLKLQPPHKISLTTFPHRPSFLILQQLQQLKTHPHTDLTSFYNHYDTHNSQPFLTQTLIPHTITTTTTHNPSSHRPPPFLQPLQHITIPTILPHADLTSFYNHYNNPQLLQPTTARRNRVRTCIRCCYAPEARLERCAISGFKKK